MSVIYKCNDGKYLAEYDVERAYTIVTGKYRFKNENDYFKWLKSIWGNYIVTALNPNKIEIDKTFATDNKVMAVKVYREQHNCTLREATDAVNALIESWV